METVLVAQAIQQLLPHRYPFLLVDRIVELVLAKESSASSR
jgi:3-hydroxymyristoyl/3-hydroxydecanoyl-(acyl carrier protein) dehydratase